MYVALSNSRPTPRAKRTGRAQTLAVRRCSNRRRCPLGPDWLTQQAERGNAEAAIVPRDREERTRRRNGELLTADRPTRPRLLFSTSLPASGDGDDGASSTIDGGMVTTRNDARSGAESHADRRGTGCARTGVRGSEAKPSSWKVQTSSSGLKSPAPAGGVMACCHVHRSGDGA